MKRNNFSLTSASQEDFNGHILQQISSRKDGANFREVPLAMQVITVFKYLKKKKKKMVNFISFYNCCEKTLLTEKMVIVANIAPYHIKNMFI